MVCGLFPWLCFSGTDWLRRQTRVTCLMCMVLQCVLQHRLVQFSSKNYRFVSVFSTVSEKHVSFDCSGKRHFWRTIKMKQVLYRPRNDPWPQNNPKINRKWSQGKFRNGMASIYNDTQFHCNNYMNKYDKRNWMFIHNPMDAIPFLNLPRDHFGYEIISGLTVYSQYWEQKRTCISSKKIKHYQGSLTLHLKLNKSFKKEKVIHSKEVLETVNCPSLCSSCPELSSLAPFYGSCTFQHVSAFLVTIVYTYVAITVVTIFLFLTGCWTKKKSPGI